MIEIFTYEAVAPTRQDLMALCSHRKWIEPKIRFEEIPSARKVPEATSSIYSPLIKHSI